MFGVWAVPGVLRTSRGLRGVAMRTIRLWLKALWFRKHWRVNWPYALYCAEQRLLYLERQRMLQRPFRRKGAPRVG